MTLSNSWPEFVAGDGPMETIIKLSRYYGSKPEIVLAGGGNTSVKVGDRLFVKGSGFPLSSISAAGFVELDRSALQALLRSELSTDKQERETQFTRAIMKARIEPEKGQRPSVEAVLHHMMPGQYVVHTHATLVNMFGCALGGLDLIGELFGNDVLWIDDIDPGFALAQELERMMADYRARSGRDCPRAVIMKNHGLVVCADTPEGIREHTDYVLGVLEARLGEPGATPFGPVSLIDNAQARTLINTIGPALRGLLASGDELKIVAFDDSPLVQSLVGGAEGAVTATGGPLTPDQIVYCRSLPLWFQPKPGEFAAELVERLRLALKSHQEATRFEPRVILVEGLGMFTVGADIGAATTVQLVYKDAIQVMAGARKLGGIRYLSIEQMRFIEDWEAESYRQQVSAGGRVRGRVAGKVAVVTGAAQGFGLEISQHLAREGAYVALADMNLRGAAKGACEIGAEVGAAKAVALAMDVTDGASVEEALHQVVRNYGGFDILISNAGVLRAGSVKTQPEKDFEFSTRVNYTGYFVCVQKAAQILVVQHQAKPGHWSDIIQINSKSGLVGSNKNGAYAGSKFGGIGLTQSFALELVEDGVKVNSICPGNFFDGPLWSDPDNGLFVQYLRTGKVPGAKTVDDVKKAYESKVPMGRGCTTPDVMKAIYYLVDQKFETGQAIPVTGGQVMLH